MLYQLLFLKTPTLFTGGHYVLYWIFHIYQISIVGCQQQQKKKKNLHNLLFSLAHIKKNIYIYIYIYIKNTTNFT